MNEFLILWWQDAKGKPFARFRGSRYELGNTDLPHFFNWIYENMGLDPEHYSAPRPPAPTPPPTGWQTITQNSNPPPRNPVKPGKNPV